MKRIFVVAIVAANLAFAASAALAGENGYHQPPYLVNSNAGAFYPVISSTVRTARGSTKAIGDVAGPAVLPNCPYCAFREQNFGH